jgi:hypothetical protein
MATPVETYVRVSLGFNSTISFVWGERGGTEIVGFGERYLPTRKHTNGWKRDPNGHRQSVCELESQVAHNKICSTAILLESLLYLVQGLQLYRLWTFTR